MMYKMLEKKYFQNVKKLEVIKNVLKRDENVYRVSMTAANVFCP